MKSEERGGAVILGGDFLGLGIIRCLSECGIPCFLVDDEVGIARFSRYTGRRAANHRLLDQSCFTDYLITLAKQYDLEGWVLYPTKDEMVKYISLDRERLATWYRIPFPSWDVISNFYHKENAYRIAARIGIPIPRMYEHTMLSDLLASELCYPIVLKPTTKEEYYTKTKKKAVLVRNEDELVREYTQMSSIIDPSRIVVQEMIEGGPRNLYSYAAFFGGPASTQWISAMQLPTP
jgi:D-aspartate ligase